MTIRTIAWRAVRPNVELALPPATLAITALLASMLIAIALLIGTTPLGSGDYGQWLMTGRPYAGLDVPAYRADASVPPTVPLVIGIISRVGVDQLLTMHIVAVLIATALGMAAYIAGSSLFGRLAGLLSAAVALLVTDLFLQLFAFGGLLQAAAIALLWLSIGLTWKVRTDPQHRRRSLVASAIAIGIGAVTHTGTASITLPVAVAVTLLAVGPRRNRLRSGLNDLVPLGLALAAVGIYWLFALLPGAADLARNPASLDYRGPARLVEALTSSWPTVAIIAIAIVSLAEGAAREVIRRQIGPWSIVAVWCGVTLAVFGAALISGASTDYPRFVTPILAPFSIAAAGGLARLGTWAGRRASVATTIGSARGWGAVLAALLIIATMPAAIGSFTDEAHGYQAADSIGLSEAATWIADNVAAGGVVLAPAREGKWVEGLTGRGTLFANAVRYNFRPDEWQRSFAADTLLRSTGGALVNEFFFAKLSDGGARDGLPRGVVIAANHGGEFVDLLRTVPFETTILGNDAKRLATFSNLSLASHGLGLRGSDALAVSVWRGERAGSTAELHQSLSVHRGSSTLELSLAVPNSVPSHGLQLSLAPGGEDVLDAVTIDGQEANLTYRALGSSAPRLRVVVSGSRANLTSGKNGTLVAHANGRRLRVLVTDLTAAPFPSAGLHALDPAGLVDQYNITAALLQRDPSLSARVRRLETLGFRVATDAGAYRLMVRDVSP